MKMNDSSEGIYSNTVSNIGRSAISSARDYQNLKRNPQMIGTTTPLPSSVTDVQCDYATVFKIHFRKGFRNKNIKTRSFANITRVLDGLHDFGKTCCLDTTPLLYVSKRQMYAILSPPSFWKELDFAEGTGLPEVFLAYRNEYHQCFFCTYADFSFFETRIRTDYVPLVKFDDLAKTHLSDGFDDSPVNDVYFPSSENFDKPPYDSSTWRFPIQATDNGENERTTVEQNDKSRSIHHGLENGHRTYPKWTAARYPDFENVENRLESYRGWPLAEPNPNTLCAVGFFFTGHSYDLVRCFCCGIGLKDFSDTDNPLLEHVKHSANCPFMLDYFGNPEALDSYKERFVTQDPEEIRRRQRETYERQQGRPITSYRAKHERFRTQKSRLDTFTHWPQHLSQRPEQLAEAGMYYTGVDDHCRCFACDGGLRKWEPGDDPWIEHCRWFPACPYAREVKGDEFINLIQLSADQALEDNVSNHGDQVNGAMAALTIDDTNIQRIVEKNRELLILDMGFPADDVITAVIELVQQATTNPDMEDIVTRLEVINERRLLDGKFKKTQEPTDPPSTEMLLEQNQRLKNILLCHICHTNQVNALFLPCTHHKYCLDCTQHCDRCPDCNRPIKEMIRTYMA